MTRSLVIAVAAALLTGCRAELHPPTDAPDDPLRQLGAGVHAQIVQGGVRVVNATTTDISLVVINPYWLGLIAPCNASNAGCTHLRPNAEEVVPTSRIHGIEDGPSELVVRYWRPGDEHPIEVGVRRP